VNLLAGMGMYFVQCGKEGKFMVPVGNAYPFPDAHGHGLDGVAPLLAGGHRAGKALRHPEGRGVDASDGKAVRAFLREHKDGAFYQGKIIAAEYFIHIFFRGARESESDQKRKSRFCQHSR
jgi:hypothetical protein